MTALTITASNVVWASGPIDKDCVAGEAFDAGDMVYLSASNTWLKALTGGTAIQAGKNGMGMALASADVAGARVSVARRDAIVTVGSGFTVGLPYFLGSTGGDLAPLGDLSSVQVTFAGLMISATQFKVGYGYDDGAVLA